MTVLFWIFTLLIILAPLPFGMVHELFQALFGCLILAVITVHAAILGVHHGVPAVSLSRIWPETLGFALVLAWVVFQMLPLAPSGWHHPFWAEAGAVLGRELSGSVSLTRGAGFESLMRLAIYATVFWLALQWGRDRRRARQLLLAVVLAGTVYAVYGLVIRFNDSAMLLWVERAKPPGSLTGTFVNRNNFATYLGLALLPLAGFYLAGFLRALSSGRRGLDRLLHILQQAFVHGAPQLAGILVLLTALFLTNSRAGVICSLLVLLVLVLFMVVLRGLAEHGARLLAASLIGAAVAVFFLSGEGWLQRLTATDLEREGRLLRYEHTWQAIGNAPWLGYGLGSYEQLFPLHAGAKTVNSDKAHNDWLEIIFELGWPAALLWFAVLTGLALRCLMGFFERRRDQLYPLIGFCASLLVGLHSLVDFSLQIPAVAVTFAVLLGVGVAQSWSSEE